MAGYVYRPTYKDPKTGEKRQSNTWWVGYSVLGRKIRESTKTSKKREAEKFLARRLAAAGHGPLQRDTDRTTLGELTGLVLNDYDQNGHRSKARIARAIGYLHKQWPKATPAVLVDEAAIERYKTRRLKTAANATVNRELSALRRAFRLGYAQQLVQRVPALRLLREQARTGFVEWADFQRLLRHLSDDMKGLTTAAYITGWRKNELLTRRWEHVDFDAGWLRLEGPDAKSGKGRQFPLTPQLRDVLEQQQRKAEDMRLLTGRPVEHVFFRWQARRDRLGTPIRNPQKAWNKARKSAGMPGTIFHDFRRTAVRNLVRAGVPEKVAMEMCGHKTRAIFDRYHIVAEGQMREAGKVLGEFHLANGMGG